MGVDMARSFGNIQSEIWRNADFRKRSASQQRTYMMLFSQPDLSAAGVLTLALTRWAGYAADTTPESIDADLRVLADNGFIVVDHDTDEVLIRTLVKWDKGYNNPKRKPAIIDAYSMVMSPHLRVVMRRELSKLGINVAAENTQADTLFDSHADSHDDSHTHRHGGRHTDIARPRGDLDLDLDLDHTRIKSFARGSDNDPQFVAFWSAYPRKVSKGHARKAWAKAVDEKKADPRTIIDAAIRFAEDPDRRRKGSELTAHPATWLNGERWTDQDERLPALAAAKASTTDARVAQGLAIAAQFDDDERREIGR